MRFEVGDTIKTMSGGDWNAGYVFGYVFKAGPRTFTVRWQSGIVNRREQGNRDFSKVTDPELLKELNF